MKKKQNSNWHFTGIFSDTNDKQKQKPQIVNFPNLVLFYSETFCVNKNDSTIQ